MFPDHGDAADRREAELREQALASTGLTPLIVTPRPFARADEVQLREAPEGLTVAQMLDLMEEQGVLDPSVRPLVRVTAGDQVLPRDLWPCARPKQGVVLFVTVTPRGSNPLRTILQIAVVALAAFAAVTLGPLWGSIAAAAVTVGGNLLINALVPIKQPEGKQREQRYSLSGSSNAASPHEPVPIVLGRRRIFPPRAANWYTTTIGNVVYLRQLFQPSVSWVDRAEPKLGDTDLDAYEGVTIRWNTKPSDGLSLSMFADTVAEDSLGAILVKNSTGWVTRAAPLECDRLSLDLMFVNGLFDTKDNGNFKNRTVQVELRYGPRGGDPGSATAAPFGVSGVVTFTRDSNDSYRQEFAWDVSSGEYDVHVRRVTADNTSNRIMDEVSWVCVRSFRGAAPIRQLDGVPWVELELQATDQLNGVPDNFNFVATSMVPQATPDGPGSLIATRNPADLLLACLYPPFSDLDLEDDERKFEAIADWADLCTAQDWKCDLVETGETSVGELLVRVAACGRARPSIDFGAVTVVVDWEKPLVRQVFSPRNVRNFRGEVVYPEEVHGLRLRFQSEDKGYQDDTITVFAPGFTEETASRYDSMEVRDKTDPDEVEWEGARVIGERIARPERFTFEQDIEHIIVGEGDRAWLIHHVALIGQVSGRIMELVRDGDDVVGVRLDEAVVMEAGKDYDLAWRGTMDPTTGLLPNRAALNVLEGERKTLYFATPPADPPSRGDLVAVGEHLLETLDVVVNRITPKAGLVAELECIPYAPELMEVGETPITSYRTGASKPPYLPGAYMVPRDVETLGALVRTVHQVTQDGYQVAHDAWSDGVLDPGEKRTWVSIIEALINSRAALRAEATALNLTVAASSAERIAYENAATALDNMLADLDTPVAWNDQSGNTDVADPAGFITAVRNAQQAERNLQTAIATTVRDRTGITDTTAPSAPSGLSVDAAFSSAFLSWTNASDDDLDKVEVWENTTNTQPNPATQPTKRIDVTAVRPGSKGAYARIGLTPGVTRYYWLRSVDKSGNISGFNASGGVAVTTLALGYTDFDTGVQPTGRGDTLPDANTYPGTFFYLNTDEKLYRKVSIVGGFGWERAIPATDISGQLADAQLAAIAASKVTGTLTDSQLAAIAAAKITGQIVATQITDGSISTPKLAAGAVTANEIAANTITAAKIAAATITATELAAGSVTTAKIAAGAVTAVEIAANTITAAKIAAGTITATELASNSVTATKIAAGVITASHIATGTITANEIAANTITAAKIAAGTITADRLQAGTLTANEIAASTITATQIAASTITAAKIIGGAVTTVTSDEESYGGTVTSTPATVLTTPFTCTESFAPTVFLVSITCTNGTGDTGVFLEMFFDGVSNSGRAMFCRANFPATVTFPIFFQPSAGSHTFSIDASKTSGSGSACVLDTAQVVITELKR